MYYYISISSIGLYFKTKQFISLNIFELFNIFFSGLQKAVKMLLYRVLSIKIHCVIITVKL